MSSRPGSRSPQARRRTGAAMRPRRCSPSRCATRSRAALARRRDSAGICGWTRRSSRCSAGRMPSRTRAGPCSAAASSHVASARDRGDYFGVHMHPLRWSDLHAGWVHDFRDGYWLRECTHGALDAFERWNGAPTELFRAGAGFLNEDVVDVLEERGVRLEVSFEPMHGWKQRSATVGSGVDSTPIVGAYLDCRRAPTSALCGLRAVIFGGADGAQPRSSGSAIARHDARPAPMRSAKPDWCVAHAHARSFARYCAAASSPHATVRSTAAWHACNPRRLLRTCLRRSVARRRAACAPWLGCASPASLTRDLLGALQRRHARPACRSPVGRSATRRCAPWLGCASPASLTRDLRAHAA